MVETPPPAPNHHELQNSPSRWRSWRLFVEDGCNFCMICAWRCDFRAQHGDLDENLSDAPHSTGSIMNASEKDVTHSTVPIPQSTEDRLCRLAEWRCDEAVLIQPVRCWSHSEGALRRDHSSENALLLLISLIK
jgi:hypothetical protein